MSVALPAEFVRYLAADSGLTVSVCMACKRMLGASPHPQALEELESGHSCPAPASSTPSKPG